MRSVSARRILSALAPMSLFVSLSASWKFDVARLAPLAAVLAAGFLLVLLATVRALTVGEERLPRLDLQVLGLGAALFLAEHAMVFRSRYVGRTDESRLGEGALRALLAGRDPYRVRIPDPTGTHLLTGAPVTHYEYPPLTLDLGWLLHHLSSRLAHPWAVATLAVLVTGVITFAALPGHWRPAAVTAVFGFGLLGPYAADGFPIVVALPLLCLAAWCWTGIGRGGRLGSRGVLQAIALGLALATQQMAWFVAVFLAVALWVVRRGELSHGRTLGVLTRFLAVALAVFAVLDLPYALRGPAAWWHGVTGVLTQGADPYGVGLILVARYLSSYSGSLRYFAVATALLFLALLAVTAAGLRRVAPAVPVFAALMFLLSARSNSEYLLCYIPLWLVWAGTTDPAAIAACRPVRLPLRRPVLTSPFRRFAAVALAVAPALAVSAAAFAVPPPLSLTGATVVRGRAGATTVRVEVTNHTGGTLRPVFAVGPHVHGTRWWAGVPRPGLAPHRTEWLVLHPGRGPVRPGRPWYVVATTADPPAIVSAPVVRTPGGREGYPGRTSTMRGSP